MTDTIPTDSLMRFLQATPEQRAVIDQFLLGASDALGGSASRAGQEQAARFAFRKAGSHWRVLLDGSAEFHLEDTLGARYLNYLLHRPNEPISAFDLEVAITPEKGEARLRDSIQLESDSRAMRDYREALPTLQLERKGARQAGDRARVRDLDRDITRVRAALREHGGLTDTGERARNNVRHAIDVITAQLEKGSRDERAFAEHLESHMSVGLECLYSQAEGRIWD